MAKYNLYGPFGGVRDAITLLSLMDDKKKRREFLDVVTALEEERGGLNEAIEVYGKAKQMDGLHAAAVDQETRARRMLDDAELEVTEMRAKAKKDTDAARGKVKLREDAGDAQKKALDERDAELTLKLEVRKSALDRRAKDLEAGRVEVSKQMAGIIEREDEYSKRKKALDAAYHSIRK